MTMHYPMRPILKALEPLATLPRVPERAVNPPSDAAYVKQIDRMNDGAIEAAEKLCRLTGAVLTDHEISESTKGKHELVLRFEGSLSVLAQLIHKLGS